METTTKAPPVPGITVRVSAETYAEVARLARDERRTVRQQLEVLLGEALVHRRGRTTRARREGGAS